MSASNWQNFWEDTPDESNASSRYRIDSVGLGLQVGMGLPVQLIHQSQAQSRVFHNQRGPFRPHNASSYKQRPKYDNRPKEMELEKTVDGIPIRTVYVKNINTEVGYHEMFNIFMRYGKIVNMHLRLNKHNNTKKHAFVTFNCPVEASRVLKIGKFKDHAGRNMYTSAADSWHQPKESADGTIILPNQRGPDGQKENEDDTEVAHSLMVQFVQEEGLNSLNDDCLMHIFSFLTWKQIAGIERVCKRWQGLSYRMWRSLRELKTTQPPFDELPKTTPVLEQCLKRCGESLTDLQLDASPNSFSKATPAIIAKYCTNLENLHLVDLSIGYRSLAHLGRQCTQLKKLVLDRCSKFADGDLLSLLPKCKDLSHLELKHCTLITGQCLTSVTGPISSLTLTNCPKLDTVHLIDSLEKVTESLQELAVNVCGPSPSAQLLSVMMSKVPNLTTLSLCNMSHSTRNIDNRGLSAIGSLSHLTSLNLMLNAIVSDHVIEPIVEGCQQLCNLNLSSSGGRILTNLTEDGLSLIGRLRKLTTLDISYLGATTDKALKNITTRNSKLKQLTCRGCPKITDEGSSQVVVVSNDLEMIDLSGCDIGTETVIAAQTSVKMRTNNVPLKLIVGGTRVTSDKCDGEEVPLLSIDLSDFSSEILRPDFIDDIFFPSSDDEDEFGIYFDEGDEDEEEDFLHQLVEGLDNHCMYGCDDLHDPTLCDQYGCDSVIRFGEMEEVSDLEDDDENYPYND